MHRQRRRGGLYSGAMAVSARDVAAILRERIPGLQTKKLHKLLYYCQAHHLAAFDAPLFAEQIVAWDMGPVVSKLWGEEKHGGPTENSDLPRAQLDEGELNTIGYVISRYGALSGKDLEDLTHSQTPWKAADALRRATGDRSVRIEESWIRDSTRANDAESEEEPQPAPDALRGFLQGAQDRRRERQPRPDSREEIAARIAELERRV